MAQGPKLFRLIARLFLPARDREFVLGDLEELHAARRRELGASAANRRYALDALASVMARRLYRGVVPPRAHPPHRGRESMLAGLPSELLAATRSLLRQPRFTAVAALTLAIGVGATAAGFGMLNQLLLRPLAGVSDPGGASYVQFHPTEDPADLTGISLPDFEELRRSASLVEGMASYGNTSINVTVGEGRPIEVEGNLVRGDFFELLGVRPAAGRLLTAEETEIGADPFVAVISERLWASHFGRAPDIAGRTFRSRGKTITILGVAADGFEGPERGSGRDLWMPRTALYALADLSVDRLLSRESVGQSNLLVRPRDGATVESLEAELNAILARIAAEVPESREHLSSLRASVLPGLHAPPNLRERTYRSLAIIGGVVGLVLLIACANVANLLLFRGVGRRGEVATRRALGASSGRVARQHLAESLVIAGLASFLGLGAGWLIGLPFRGMSLLRTAPFEGLALDGRVFLFALGATLLTTLLFGSLPALMAGRFDLGDALRDAGARETGRRATLRSVMSATQIALSLALLVGALLLLRTVDNLYAVDSGVSIDRVTTLTIDYGDIPDESQDARNRALLAAVRAVPGVEQAALDVYGPFSAGMGGRIRLAETPEAERQRASMTQVTPGWFELFGVEPIAGRTFRPADWEPGAPPTVVLTAELARTLFGTTDGVGRRVLAGFGNYADAEVIGVVDDLKIRDPRIAAEPMFFQPYPPVVTIGYVTLFTKVQSLDAGVLARITSAVEGVFPDLPVPAAAPLVTRIDARLIEQRLFARMIGLLAALSALLAAVGLYGLVSFTVASRRRELGIRLALGADGRSIAQLIGRYALGIVFFGSVLGLGGAYALSKLLERLLFGVSPGDPASFATGTLLFAAVAALACWVPTRAAMRVDPVGSLRGE
jgi:predicted permease